jgi:hypothetical protein
MGFRDKSERSRGNGSRLFEALHRESARELFCFPMRIRTQPSLRANDELDKKDERDSKYIVSLTH